MTTLITGELSGFDDDSFRVSREHVLGKGVTRLTAGERPLSPDGRPLERSTNRMSPVVGMVQRAKAHRFIDESPVDISPAPTAQPETRQAPAFTPVRLWEVAIGDTKASPADIKGTTTRLLDEAVAGGQLTSEQAEALWLELVDGQDKAEIEQDERDAMMTRLYDMYAATSELTPFASQPEYTIPFIKYTRATKDRGPKTIPEIREDLNRLEMGRNKLRRETVALQIAGVMQVVLEMARAGETKPI